MTTGIRGFPLTKRKFLSLTDGGRHKWIIRWLSGNYQQLLTNRISPGDLDLLYNDCCRAFDWMGRTPGIPRPSTHSPRLWMTFISDIVHRLRQDLGHVPRDHDLLPHVTQGDRRLPATNTGGLDYHLALDGLRSLFNVGSIFRTCDAAGVESLILGNVPGSEHLTVRKTSMGTADWLPHTRTDDLAGFLLEKKHQGYPVIGLETAETATAHDRFSWGSKGIVVLGNEEYGISNHVLDVCDHLVSIPMAGRKNSINVASAAAVIVFHIASCLRTNR